MFPGEENPELTNAVEQASTEGTAEGQTPSFVDDHGQADQLRQTSGNRDQGQQQGAAAGKFYNGKYKSLQDWEKGHKSLEQQYGRVNSRAQMLEKLIERNAGSLGNDPETREILGKLGYELMEEESREDERSQGGPVQWDPNDPKCQIAQLRAEISFKEERSDLQEQLGRKLSDSEVAAIKQIIQVSPRLNWSQAWRLTSHYEKSVADQQEKAIQKALARSPVARPKPSQMGTLAAPKGPQGKSPLGLKDEEKASFLNDLINRGG